MSKVIEAKDVKAAFDIINKWPLFPRKPVSAEEDANGVVTLKDEQGNPVAMMPKSVYEELLEYEPSEGDLPVEEP